MLTSNFRLEVLAWSGYWHNDRNLRSDLNVFETKPYNSFPFFFFCSLLSKNICTAERVVEREEKRIFWIFLFTVKLSSKKKRLFREKEIKFSYTDFFFSFDLCTPCVIFFYHFLFFSSVFCKDYDARRRKREFFERHTGRVCAWHVLFGPRSGIFNNKAKPLLSFRQVRDAARVSAKNLPSTVGFALPRGRNLPRYVCRRFQLTEETSLIRPIFSRKFAQRVASSVLVSPENGFVVGILLPSLLEFLISNLCYNARYNFTVFASQLIQ